MDMDRFKTDSLEAVVLYIYFHLKHICWRWWEDVLSSKRQHF